MAYMSSLNTGGVLPITTSLYGTCDTAAATAAKVVTCSDFDTITDGFRIAVLFTLGNTATSSVTININNKGAINVDGIYTFGTYALIDLIYITNKFYIVNNNIKDYLPLTSGTLSGNLQIAVPNSDSPIILGDLNDTSHVGYILMARNTKYMQMSPQVLTANRTIELPDKSGTVALSGDVVKLSSSITQTVTNTVGATALGVKTGTNGAVYESFANSGGTLGYLGVNASNKLIYQSAAGGGDKEIALVDNTTKFAVVSGSRVDYRKLVVGLCKIGTEKGSWCSAKLIFHRFNGLRPLNVLALSICGNYYNNTQCNATIEYSNLTKQSQSPDGGSYPGYAIVTFKHNNEWYAGIEYCYQASADFIYAEYSGSIDPFAFAWYRTDTSTILDQEYADSVTYDAYNQLQACHAGV